MFRGLKIEPSFQFRTQYDNNGKFRKRADVLGALELLPMLVRETRDRPPESRAPGYEPLGNTPEYEIRRLKEGFRVASRVECHLELQGSITGTSIIVVTAHIRFYTKSGKKPVMYYRFPYKPGAKFPLSPVRVTDDIPRDELGYLLFRTAKKGLKCNEPSLWSSDVVVMRRELPDLQLWKRLPKKELNIELNSAEATELLVAMRHHLKNKEWDRDPYTRSFNGDSGPMWWHRLFRDELVPYLEERLTA